MPIYEFRCQTCGRKSEHLLKMDYSLSPDCPHCGGSQLKRILFSRVVIHGVTPKSEGAMDDFGDDMDDGGMGDDDFNDYDGGDLGGGLGGGYDDDDF